jgi:DNA-binding MarR family transcriptional regulator
MVRSCGGNMKETEKNVMKNPIENLNKTFDSRIRLGIMSAIMVNASINFNALKELIKVTDGNLASHIKALEESGFIKVQKGFIGRKTNTVYSATIAGEKAFRNHLDALEQMIKNMG